MVFKTVEIVTSEESGMKRLTLSLLILCLAALPRAEAHHQGNPEVRNADAYALDGLGNLHHKVSTTSPEAQRFFDQGLSLVYAFNHDEAVRSFRKAAELDPKLAMAWWGVAYALGP